MLPRLVSKLKKTNRRPAPSSTVELSDDSRNTILRDGSGASYVIHFPRHGTSPWERFWEEHKDEETNCRKHERMKGYV